MYIQNGYTRLYSNAVKMIMFDSCLYGIVISWIMDLRGIKSEGRCIPLPRIRQWNDKSEFPDVYASEMVIESGLMPFSKFSSFPWVWKILENGVQNEIRQTVWLLLKVYQQNMLTYINHIFKRMPFISVHSSVNTYADICALEKERAINTRIHIISRAHAHIYMMQ